MSNNEFWKEKERAAAAIEEQIDPSFSNQQTEALQSLRDLQQHEPLESQTQTGSEPFDVAAAAVAASTEKASEIPDTNVPSSTPDNGVTLSRNGKALTNTKRAHQNRMAQRAFRQRKEQYIKDLEERAKEVEMLKKTIEDLRAENNQLRDYSLTLQAKLIEQPDVPAPPVIFAAGRNKKA